MLPSGGEWKTQPSSVRLKVKWPKSPTVTRLVPTGQATRRPPVPAVARSLPAGAKTAKKHVAPRPPPQGASHLVRAGGQAVFGSLFTSYGVGRGKHWEGDQGLSPP